MSGSIKSFGTELSREGLERVINKFSKIDQLVAESFKVRLKDSKEDELNDLAYLLAVELVLKCHYQHFKSRPLLS